MTEKIDTDLEKLIQIKQWAIELVMKNEKGDSASWKIHQHHVGDTADILVRYVLSNNDSRFVKLAKALSSTNDTVISALNGLIVAMKMAEEQNENQNK